MQRKKKSYLKFSFLLSLLFYGLDLWARGGGAGGGHSGGGFGGGRSGGGFGGGGYGGPGVIYYSNDSDGGFVTLVIIALLIYAAYSIYRRTSRSNQIMSDDFPRPAVVQLPEGESEDDLLRKVAAAFLAVQESWSQQKLESMRRFITDGVYQRFNAQFLMMKELGQQNPISEVGIQKIALTQYHREGNYDVVQVGLQAEATDQFVCEKFPNLNSPGGHESFIEYWTFIRRADYKRGGDIFTSELCPKCSAALTNKLLETARCPYCNTYLNSGEYDWVLAEITQSEDQPFPVEMPESGQEQFPLTAEEVSQIWPPFSPHVLQDKASNAFMQILIGEVTRNLSALQRFMSADFFAKIQSQLPQHRLVYDRLFTRRVDFLGAKKEGSKLFVAVGLRYSYHEIDLDTALRTLPPPDDLPPDTQILVLMRTLSERTSMGSVYAGSCPQCGAAVKDNLASSCSYCGATFNNSELDWIVTDVLNY
jgi:Zn-finger nucleic acid-binding protein